MLSNWCLYPRYWYVTWYRFNHWRFWQSTHFFIGTLLLVRINCRLRNFPRQHFSYIFYMMIFHAVVIKRNRTIICTYLKLAKNHSYRYTPCWRNAKIHVRVYQYCLLFTGALGFEERGTWGGFLLVLALSESWKWGASGRCGVAVIEKGLQIYCMVCVLFNIIICIYQYHLSFIDRIIDLVMIQL